MIKEKAYKYKNYQISYDEDLKDRSVLVIGIKEKDTLYIVGELYDESANAVIKILDNLESQIKQKENIIKEVRELANTLDDNEDYIGQFIRQDILDILDEVEVIEEDKKIEKSNLDIDELRGKEIPRAIDYLLESKINEIIDYINKEK